MKQLRVSFAVALILAGLVLTSILHSETRRLTAKESAAIGACASRYYVCNGRCQNSPAGEARATCEAECMRVYNACVGASIGPPSPTELRVAPSPSAVGTATPTPVPRKIPPQRGTGAANTTIKPIATIAPGGVVPKQVITNPTPAPRNVSSQRGGAPSTMVNASPQPTVVSQSVARRLASSPTVASPTPTPVPPNFSRRPISGTMRAKPTPTLSPQGGLQGTASTVAPPSPTPATSPHRSLSARKSHRKHRSREVSPTPSPTSQPTPAT